jgi:hypothetical protein
VAGAGGVDGQVSGELVHSARDGHDSGELLHSARASDAAAPARRTEAATAAHEAACAAASARDAIRCAARPDKRQGERRVCTLLGWRKKTGLNHDHRMSRHEQRTRSESAHHGTAQHEARRHGIGGVGYVLHYKRASVEPTRSTSV